MISIIITAFREEKTIGKTINSILNQDLKDSEIIVIAPDRDTLNEAKKYKVKTIKDPGKGKPTALNIAFEKAKGDILILTDGDVFIEKDSLKSLIKYFEDKNVGAVSGHPVPLNERNNFFGYFSHFLTHMADKLRKKLVSENKFIVCSGYLYAIRNKIEKMPGNILSDDAYISKIIHDKGYEIKYSENSIVYVKYPDNLKDWIKQKRRSTGGYEQLRKLFGKKVMRSFGQEASGIFEVIIYPKNIKEFLWAPFLIFLRLYLWIKIFIDLKIRKLSFEKTWVRIESTK